MNNAFNALQGHQFINLTTYRKSGEPVVTTVWFAQDGDRIVGTTQRQAGKIKRMRNNPEVSVAPSTVNGQALGDAVKGVARELPPEEETPVKAALKNKYGAQYDQITANADPAQRVYWEVKPA
jgi:PPOX class probable F420-dependent enzyme